MVKSLRSNASAMRVRTPAGPISAAWYWVNTSTDVGEGKIDQKIEKDTYTLFDICGVVYLYGVEHEGEVQVWASGENQDRKEIELFWNHRVRGHKYPEPTVEILGKHYYKSQVEHLIDCLEEVCH